MLLRFVVSNFLSFSEEVKFNCFPYKRYKTHRHHIYITSEIDLLKTSAIYGANGSGKSNWVKALEYLRHIACYGKIRENSLPVYHRFGKKYNDIPTSFEVELKHKDRYFAYGVKLKDDRITEEWLYELSPSKGTDKMIFERKQEEEKIILDVHEKYKKSERDKMLIELYEQDFLTPHSSFLHLVNEKDFIEINLVSKWFLEQLNIFPAHSIHSQFQEMIHDNTDFRAFINRTLPHFDTGIDKIEKRQLPYSFYFKNEAIKKHHQAFLKERNYITVQIPDTNNHYLKITKNNKDELVIDDFLPIHRLADDDVVFDYSIESDGTMRLLELLMILYEITYQEQVVVIDEISKSLHPNALRKFLELFLNSETKGQLIFTSHESQLLDLELFRQDEIWFTQKTKAGNSTMYSLQEFKPRNDKDIRRGYLFGRYGAVPNFTNTGSYG